MSEVPFLPKLQADKGDSFLYDLSHITLSSSLMSGDSLNS